MDLQQSHFIVPSGKAYYFRHDPWPECAAGYAWFSLLNGAIATVNFMSGIMGLNEVLYYGMNTQEYFVPYDTDDPGLDDLTVAGTYTDSVIALFEVEIDATGTPDTFKWRKAGGSWTTGVSITGAAQTLSDGVTVAFAATTGHTKFDRWQLPQTPPASFVSHTSVGLHQVKIQRIPAIDLVSWYEYEILWISSGSGDIEVDIAAPFGIVLEQHGAVDIPS